MPRSKKTTLRRRSLKGKSIRKSIRKSKRKSIRKSKRKSIRKSKITHNSQFKTIEYPDYNNKSELVGTDLRNKVIHGAYMKNMNLSGAKLHGTKFVDCTFINTNFDHAYIDKNTEFINCTFRQCKTDMIKYVGGADKANFELLFTSSVV